MKSDIHPKYYPLELHVGDRVYKTYSTLSSGTLRMDVDYLKQPAWVGKGVFEINSSSKNVSDFEKKFAGLTFGMSKPKA